MSYDVAFIGTGPEPENQVWGESAAMAYRHAWGYDRLANCDLVACADLVRENAEDFADEFDIDYDHIFEDYAAMCHEVEPDVVSICTPLPTHADLVTGVAETGVVDAIHCEKPMAMTWADAERMAAVCEGMDVQLTFDHQRRFAPRWREARALLADGGIGELRRIETNGPNFFDYGTHMVDLCHSFVDERDPAWVLASLDYRRENVRYGAHNENQLVAIWRYGNGVHALAATGRDVGTEVVGCAHRLIGSEGEIEVGGEEPLRVRRDGEGWETVDVAAVSAIAYTREEGGRDAIAGAIAHVVECLDAGAEPELSAENALRATEVVFGAYESVRRRGRVEFPLDVEGNPMEAMVEAGDLRPS